MVAQVIGSLTTETRQGNKIENHFDRSPLIPGTLLQCQNYKNKYKEEEHGRGVPSTSYNCHGLTFGSRRTGITRPDVVRAILREDDYVKIDRSQVLPGDAVIYIDDQGDVVHSGIVMQVMLLGVKVLSKWGDCHEVIHGIGNCPYPNTSKEYYRVCK